MNGALDAVRMRSALLDALEALASHSDSVVIIGARLRRPGRTPAPVGVPTTPQQQERRNDTQTALAQHSDTSEYWK